MESPEVSNGLLPVERELCDRVRWFVQLRWIAGVTVLATGAALRWGLGWQVPLAVEAVGLFVLLYNVLFWWSIRRLQPGTTPQTAWSHLANAQVSADLIALTALIHLTGGLYSPLLSFAVFHIMIASLLLRRRDVFLQAGLAIVLVGLMVWVERSGRLSPQNLGGRLPDTAASPPVALLLPFLGFVALLTTAAYLASTIRYALRDREQQVAQVQQNLRQAYKQLEELDRAKTHFALMVTHELRSPVAAVQSLLEILQRGYVGELPAQAQQMVERAVQRVTLLAELIRQLLDLAREKAELTLERAQPVPVESLLRQVEDAYRPQAEMKGIRFLVELPEEPLSVQGDPDELGKLLSNLVSNAVKYTPNGGQTSLRAWQEDGRVVMEVRDTGIGIPQGEQDRLFTEFFRASNAKQVAEHGTGLGLAIVKRIVDHHGGDIRFSSEEGKGTTFWVYLAETAKGGDIATR